MNGDKEVYILHRGNTSISNLYEDDSQADHLSQAKSKGIASVYDENSKKANFTPTYGQDLTTGIKKAIGVRSGSFSSQNIQENKATITYDDDGDKKINQYRVISFLGKGAFAKVKLVENQDNQIKYAMKIQNKKKMKKVALKTGKDNFNLFQKEIAIMKKISHPNLIQLLEIIDDSEKGKIYFIMDFMDLGFISSPLHMAHIKCKSKFLPEDKLLKYFRACLQGLDYCKY